MKRLIYAMPSWVHNLILRVTGYRLVRVAQVTSKLKRVLIWTRDYPLGR